MYLKFIFIEKKSSAELINLKISKESSLKVLRPNDTHAHEKDSFTFQFVVTRRAQVCVLA